MPKLKDKAIEAFIDSFDHAPSNDRFDQGWLVGYVAAIEDREVWLPEMSCA